MNAVLNRIVITVTIVLELLILSLLLKRRLGQRFFWFSLYITYVILESILRVTVTGHYKLYYRVYWLTEIGDVAAAAMAFRESFLNVFYGYARLRWFVAVVWACIGAALLYALFKALVFPPVRLSPTWPIIIDLEVAINFALCVVGILYFTLLAFFRIQGRRWESGIISGFTIYVALQICVFLITSIFGNRFTFLVTWLGSFGYILAELTWVLELSRKEPSIAAPSRNLTVDDLTKLGQYNTFLKRLWRRRP